MLSRKYYRVLAGIIRTSKTKEELVQKLIRFLEADNPRFDRERFLRACHGLSYS